MALNPYSNLIHIVLVETETPGNLGASARALKNMGLRHLRLVNPKRVESREAQARAVHAQDILKQALVYTDLKTALADCSLVIGTSGQIETLDQPRYTPRALAEYLSQELKQQNLIGPIALVFGRESKGLNKEELALCHAHIRIPSDSECPSLNLASAVQLICYELLVTLTDSSELGQSELNAQPGQQRATHGQQDYFLSQLELLAIQVEALNPEEPRQMMHKMQALFLRAQPRRAELDLLLNLIKRVLGKLAKKTL